MNGDLILWNKVLNRAFEISSMGIRVDGDAMLKQLKIPNGRLNSWPLNRRPKLGGITWLPMNGGRTFSLV